MRYELKQNQGIPTPLLALMAIDTGLSVANCYYNWEVWQELLM